MKHLKKSNCGIKLCSLEKSDKQVWVAAILVGCDWLITDMCEKQRQRRQNECVYIRFIDEKIENCF